MRKPVWIGIVLFVVVLILIMYSTIGSSGFRVEVCLDFRGRDICKVASGETQEFALRSAISNACGEIASGVTDTIACQATQPKSITWLTRGK